MPSRFKLERYYKYSTGILYVSKMCTDQDLKEIVLESRVSVSTKEESMWDDGTTRSRVER